jgi:hypothetical protein
MRDNGSSIEFEDERYVIAEHTAHSTQHTGLQINEDCEDSCTDKGSSNFY